ncbi:MAG: ABC transporter permease [Bacilli bacterium]
MKLGLLITKIIVISLSIICIIPVVITVCFAFFSNWIFPDILPKSLTLENFIRCYYDNGIGIFMTSLIVALLSSIISLVVGTFCAKGLAHYNFKYKNLIMLAVLLPLIIPSFTIVSIAHINMIKLHIDSTIIGVSLIHSFFAIPYVIRIMMDYFEIVGMKREQTARCLGASNFQTMKFITIPLVKNGILISLFFAITVSISQYVTTLIIGGGKVLTLTTMLVPFIRYGNYKMASVYSVFTIMISILAYLILVAVQKSLERIKW